MSRSYKKYMGGCFGGGSDKYSRSVYHRSKRRTDRKYCYELYKKYEISEIFERESNFCLKCMLYTEDICSGVIRKFDSDLFCFYSNWRHEAQSSWIRYQSALKNKKNYAYDFINMVVSRNLAKKQFLTNEELIAWFREKQKWLIKVWKKLNYGK